ncbi:RNA-binding protein NOB1-like isoform X2 [Sphaeramia orbicularis]|uniref:RNA-binding protein NOB1-like isoform X2 n=1 Tax=Sphaeramia orbicularis TaxID=375764 RepID=UPI00117D563C|nr:RNA-binding protein NOB1-like isoform X2 [Sphaeramia orbicularis]
MAPTLVEHVVADAGAFLKKSPLQEIGRNIYTLRDVVNEIRDKPTRRSLAVLPYQLNLKEPHPEHIHTVTEFSKKTGDYPSLSATDIKVLALTYQLELEHVGSQHLKKEPVVKVNIQSTQRHPETPVNVAGFHFPSKCFQRPAGSSKVQETVTETETSTTADCEQFNSFHFWREPLPSIDADLLDLLEPADVLTSNKTQKTETNIPTSSVTADSEQFNSFNFWREPLPSFDDELLGLLEDGVSGSRLDTSLHSEDEDDKENEPDEEEEDEDDDDGGGWITPSNIKQVKMDSADWTAPADIKVGCLTTDFAMQNVLIQIGLHVLSVNGMVIKQARNFILRCHACFKTTSNMSKVFCPHCGNSTLKKVAVTVNEDGSKQMHFSRNPKVMNPKGLKYSLPLPQGGKHGSNPHLTEDQRFPQQRLSRKARQKTDVFNPDYVAGSSPFCENDIYSRAANLQIRDSQCGGGRRRANPNTARKKFVKKK